MIARWCGGRSLVAVVIIIDIVIKIIVVVATALAIVIVGLLGLVVIIRRIKSF